MVEENNPLVSINVITYNSSKFVLETLESAKAQTYQNIELIVSDDCSTDNTVDICREWIEKNKYRFVRTELITVEKNTGIAANCNRALKASKGEWIKGIAGDDVLLPSCIDLFMSFIEKEPNARIIQSSIDYYRDNFSNDNFIRTRDLSAHPIADITNSAFEQYKILLKGSVVNAPGAFISSSLLKELGGYDESYRFEDWPMWLKATKNNNKIYYLNKSTVKYRIHSDSMYQSNTVGKIFGGFYKIERPMIENEILPNVSFIRGLEINYRYRVKLTFDKMGINNNSFFLKLLFSVLYNPVSTPKRVLKKLLS